MITNELISEIKSKINDNHKQAITGGNLQGVLVDMVKSLCEVYPQTYTDEEKAQARANIDALSNYDGEIAKEKLSLEVQAILNDVANKQNISDATLATIAKTIVGAINEVYKGGLEDASIATSKIEDGAITDAKIANGAVTTPKIANDAVTTEKVNDGAITEPKLDTDLVNIITSAVQPAGLASAIATALASYVAKADIVDTTGSATDKVMSQHGVTEAIDGVTNKVTELESQLTDLYGIEEVEKVSTTTDTYITPDRSWLVQVQNGHKYRLVINAQWGITQFSGISQDNAMLYVDNGNGSAYFSHSLSMGFSVLEHTLTANTETLNIRYRADNGSIVSLSIIDISDQKTLYALDKRIVIDAILSEAFTVDSLTRDSDGNVISGNIKYSDGIAGTIAITRNADGNATSMVATHGTDSYTLSIMRNANGDVTKTSIN